MFVSKYSEDEAREAVRTSFNYTEALRKLGLRPAGGNHKLFRRWVDEIWKVPTDHFDPDRARHGAFGRDAVALEEVLVEHSSYSRRSLKARLLASGLKPRYCELCGQDEMWRGSVMGLILDHINGVPKDNRIGNLRIVCPNCNATFDTHCGRRSCVAAEPRACLHCGAGFVPKFSSHRYCCRECGLHSKGPRRSHPERRKGGTTFLRPADGRA